MRVVLLGLIAVGLIAGSASANPLPQTLCRGWSDAATVSMSGSTEAGRLTGRMEQVMDARSGRYAATRDYGVFQQGEGFDGHDGWSRDRSGGSHPLDSEPARAIARSEAWVRRRGWCDAAEMAGIGPLPDEVEDGRVEAVWRVTPKGGTPVLLRFDRATGYLRQSELWLWGSRLIRRFDDWRDAGGGLLIPYAERDEYPEDESVETIKLTSLHVSQRAAKATVFAQPPRPHDYAILGGGASTTVPYEDDGVARIFVPVFVDGHGPFAFELDTGGHLIFTAATAAAMKLAAVGAFNGTGGGTGIVKQGIVNTREIRIGAAVLRDQPAKVVPLSETSNDRGARPPRGGILGLELFERFAVQLNRRAKTMTLTPLEHFQPPARGVALPIRFTEDAPTTRGSFSGVPGDFELDSGDSAPAIVEGYWATQHGLAERLSKGLDWTGAGVGGEYHEIISRGDFTLGPIKLPHEVVSYVGLVARGSESTRLQAGLVGESSLYRFDETFDYRRGMVWLKPVPGLARHNFNRSGLRTTKPSSDRMTAAIVLPGSPAETAGLATGDQILAVNGAAVSTLSTTDVLVLMSGPVGARVTLNVVPKAGGGAHDTIITLRDLF